MEVPSMLEGQMIKVIVFDFDGVIVPLSELVKQGAWGFIANHRDINDRVVVAEAEKYYGRNKGNRYDILRRIFEKLGKDAKEIPILIERHANRFNRIVQEGIRSLGIREKDKIALEILKWSCNYILYINSGTPEQEINETFERSGIKGLFQGIYGQERGKVGNIKRAMEDAGKSPAETVFVGDSDWDFRAAEEAGCHFIGMSNLWNEWKDKPFPLISSLAEISEALKTLKL